VDHAEVGDSAGGDAFFRHDVAMHDDIHTVFRQGCVRAFAPAAAREQFDRPDIRARDTGIDDLQILLRGESAEQLSRSRLTGQRWNDDVEPKLPTGAPLADRGSPIIPM
jgi:hypothetical protein